MLHKLDSWMVARFPLQQPFSSVEVKVVRCYSKLNFFFALFWQHFFLIIFLSFILVYDDKTLHQDNDFFLE